MDIKISQIERLAHLARLAIEESDYEHYRQEISDVIDLVSELQQIDTRGVMPMSNPHQAKQTLRDDVVRDKNDRELFQHNAPAIQDGLYLVPKVITD